MIFLLYEKETDTKARVISRHYRTDLLSTETKARGMEVTSIPQPEKITGKDAVLYVNPKTGELWYEYFNRPLTPEEKIKQLTDQLDVLSLEILKLKGLA